MGGEGEVQEGEGEGWAEALIPKGQRSDKNPRPTASKVRVTKQFVQKELYKIPINFHKYADISSFTIIKQILHYNNGLMFGFVISYK